MTSSPPEPHSLLSTITTFLSPPKENNEILNPFFFIPKMVRPYTKMVGEKVKRREKVTGKSVPFDFSPLAQNIKFIPQLCFLLQLSPTTLTPIHWISIDISTPHPPYLYSEQITRRSLH